MGKNKKKSKSKTSQEKEQPKDQSPENITGEELNTSEEPPSGSDASADKGSGEDLTRISEDSEKKLREEEMKRKRENSDSSRPSRKSENVKDYSSSRHSERGENKNWNSNRPIDSRRSEPFFKSNQNEGGPQKRRSWNDGDSRKVTRDNSNSRRYNSRRSIDNEFFAWQEEFRSHRGKIEYVKTKEIIKDLFELEEEYSLAHCVAEDMNMGAGIAVQFRRQFKKVADLLNQRQQPGGLALLKENSRFIYYLVTKRFSSGKPTNQTLFASLKELRTHVIRNGVNKLAMPRIGCGLDRLEWDEVKSMLEFIFKDADIEIVVCNLEPTEDSPSPRHRNCKVTYETYPIETIEKGTVILYFSSEDEAVSEEMLKLDEKFHFLTEFRSARKRLGNIVVFTKNADYIVCGCIVKKAKSDPFDFEAFQKCVYDVQKQSRNQFFYYAFQTIEDQDSLLNDKITNILRNSLHNAEVYVCSPERKEGSLKNEQFDRNRDFPRQSSFKKSDSWRPKDDQRDSASTSQPKIDGYFYKPSQKNFEKSANVNQNDSIASSSSWPTQDRDLSTSTCSQEFEKSADVSQNPESKTDGWDWTPQNISESRVDPSQQNYSFGNFEPVEQYDNSWPKDEDQSKSTEAQAKSTEQNQSSYPSHTQNSGTWTVGNWNNTPQASQITHVKESAETTPQEMTAEITPQEMIDREYKRFELDLENKSLDLTVLKEQHPSSLPVQYSRVCYASENLVIQDGIPPGQDIDQVFGKLLGQNQKEGGLAYVKEGNNFLYCLIVSKATELSTRYNVFSAIRKLRDHAERNGVRNLVIPTMNCSGSDFQWSDVKCMFQFLLGKSRIEMTLASFQTKQNLSTSSKKKGQIKNEKKIIHVKSGLFQTKKNSMIIYLASADGQITDEMNRLNRTFDFKGGFERSIKSLGSVIQYKDEGHVLYGCVVKEKHTHGINFEKLQKCFSEINEKNKAEKLPLAAIQAVGDGGEGVNDKICTLLLTCLKDVNVNMCWPGDLKNLMPKNT